ncbi:unnamed protein product [Dimorphilus gyrociliatus]|uniref:SSD domain-containing protein n=1 Tax=Dimorphilus gyrociliatus TaxID=2664684 RepID=A0A7I8VT15_9ANNE|nr:unnamed protein product [Dimorphilus gyrociliatus]
MEFLWERAAAKKRRPMPIWIVWGVIAKDRRHSFSPTTSYYPPIYDHLFNPSANESQLWLLNFCKSMRKIHYVDSKQGLLPGVVNGCYIEGVVDFVRQSCLGVKDFRCCKNATTFPLMGSQYEECVDRWRREAWRTSHLFYGSATKTSGLRYDFKRKLSGLIVQFDSTQPYTRNYEDTLRFREAVENDVKKLMKSAPPEMSNGFFTSEFNLVDLQNHLLKGVQSGVIVSVCVAGFVSLIGSLNLILAILSTLCIAAATSATLGLLTLVSPELDSVQAVLIVLSVGLCVDGILQVSMAYRLSPDLRRLSRLRTALKNCGPAVTFSSLSTGAIGISFVFAPLRAYFQLGALLAFVSLSTWLTGIFVLPALLSVVGPEGDFLQANWPTSNCCESDGSHEDKTVYAVQSEETASTSHSLHELEPLTPAEPPRRSPYMRPAPVFYRNGSLLKSAEEGGERA